MDSSDQVLERSADPSLPETTEDKQKDDGTGRPLVWIRGVAALMGMAAFAPILLQLYAFSQNGGSQHHSYFPLIPLIAGYLVFTRRREILLPACQGAVLSQRSSNPLGRPAFISAVLVTLSILLFMFRELRLISLSLNDQLSLATTSLVLYVIGGFIWVFGLSAFRVVRFPLLFLVFMIPMPEILLRDLVAALQIASTQVVDSLFGLSGVVYLRDGFVFSLPGLNIEVAEQCSGIRSALSLFIVSILIGHAYLRSTSGRIALALAVLPITVVKNGIRIVLLSLLAVHWDESILHGSLHSIGGIPFFVVAVTLLCLVLLGIRKFERWRCSPVDDKSSCSRI